MVKKITLTIIFAFIAAFCWSQKHVLPEPKGWGIETFPFPIEFAPNIPFSGEEELRFSPGWGETESDQLWSYSFLWWVKSDSKLDAASLKKYLEEYYGGLVGRNIEKRSIPASKVVPTVATITAGKDKSKPFTATVSMLDYMGLKPIKLNIEVNVKDCSANGKKGIFFMVSPQPRTHEVWKTFDSIWNGFTCGD